MKFLQFPWFPGSLRCVAQNPRILLMVNLIQRIHYNYACAFYFSLFVIFFSSRPDVLHTFIKCASADLANRASRTSSNRLFRGVMTPYTHACEGRPPTTVVRTSLSVIVIGIVIEMEPCLPKTTTRFHTHTIPTRAHITFSPLHFLISSLLRSCVPRLFCFFTSTFARTHMARYTPFRARSRGSKAPV